MIKSRFFAAAAAALLAAAGTAPAQAKSQDSQTNGSAAAASAKGERKICKTFANTTSRMRSERLCLTRAEWRRFEAQQ